MGVRLLLTVECKGCNVIGPENIFRLYCISCSNGACAFPINDSEMAHSCELEAGVVGKDSKDHNVLWSAGIRVHCGVTLQWVRTQDSFSSQHIQVWLLPVPPPGSALTCMGLSQASKRLDLNSCSFCTYLVVGKSFTSVNCDCYPHALVTEVRWQKKKKSSSLHFRHMICGLWGIWRSVGTPWRPCWGCCSYKWYSGICCLLPTADPRLPNGQMELFHLVRSPGAHNQQNSARLKSGAQTSSFCLTCGCQLALG